MNLGDKKAFIFARLGVRIKEGFLSRYFLSVSACLSTNKGIKCPKKKCHICNNDTPYFHLQGDNYCW